MVLVRAAYPDPTGEIGQERNLSDLTPAEIVAALVATQTHKSLVKVVTLLALGHRAFPLDLALQVICRHRVPEDKPNH